MAAQPSGGGLSAGGPAASPGRLPARPSARWVQGAAALLTAGLVVLTVATAVPGRLPAALVIALAVAWGAGGTVADLLAGRSHTWAPRTETETETDAPAVDDGGTGARAGGFTTLMRLGDVPDEIARTALAVAAGAGPVVLVVSGPDAPDGLPPDVTVVHDDGGDGLAVAVRAVDTDAVLVSSARALPCAEACRAAAARLSGGADWVTGCSEPLNRDHFGPDRRDLVDGRLRRRLGDAGLWLWENDATLVRTALLAERPFRTDHPLGAWLRDRARDGHRGDHVDDALTLRALPVAAAGYWPDTSARQRAAAADLSDAVWRRGTPVRARSGAAALLVRALSGWSLVWWLAALVLVGDGFPVEVAPIRYGTMLGVVLVLRWLALRWSVGVRPGPVADVLAALYAAPGSLAATGAALTGRVRRSRWPVPTRPLVWVALVATVVAANGLLSVQPGRGSSRVAAVASVAMLVLLWVFTVRSLVERTWDRTGFRVRVDLPASVTPSPTSAGPGSVTGAVVDASPGGLAFEGPPTGLARGDEVHLELTLGDGTLLEVGGTVASRRRRPHLELLGVEIRTVAPDRGPWAAELVRAAGAHRPLDHPVVAERSGSARSRAGTWLDRLVMAAVVLTSVVVVAALTLVLVGFRPLVIRSGSMMPTYTVGDVVLVETVRAAQLRPGEVSTRFDAPEAEDGLTHRVVSVREEGDRVVVTTRGDANDSNEVWTVPAVSSVGRVAASVPLVGRPATLVRSSTGWAVAGVVAVALLVGTLVVGPRLGRRRPGPADDRPDRTGRADRVRNPR